MTFPDPKYLTHPNIPKPLHGINPRTVMGQAWWDIKRKEAYTKNLLCCWACGEHKLYARYHQWLEGHEGYNINYKTGKVKLEEIIALCHSCHNFIHSGRMYMLYQKKEMPHEKVKQILIHGMNILDEAKLEPFFGTVALWNLIMNDNRDSSDPDEDLPMAKWSKWHMVIEGKKYYSKFKDINEWAEYYK